MESSMDHLTLKVTVPVIGWVSEETALHSTLYVPGVSGAARVMTITIGSSLPATLALTPMGEWADMPGISVMISFAPENWVVSFSEKLSSIFAGAATVAPSTGVEDSNFGCAWAAVLNNKPMLSAATAPRALNDDMQGS